MDVSNKNRIKPSNYDVNGSKKIGFTNKWRVNNGSLAGYMRATAADQTIHGCWNWWIDSICLHQLVVSRILEAHWSIPELCMSLLLQVWERLSFDQMVTHVCIIMYIIVKHIYIYNYIYILIIYIHVYGEYWERERKHLQSHPHFTVHSSH